MENRHIAFSPPDITEEEITEVVDTLKSGWITTGPKTKKFEKKLAEYIGTSKVVCLNSATACAEMILRVLGIGEGDEVITTAYTYTATASVIAHVGAKIVMVDVNQDSYQMNMNQVEAAVTEKTKAIIMVDLGGRICDYTRAFEIAEEKRSMFHPKSEIQKKMGRIAIMADGAHAMGAVQNGKRCGAIADFTSFSFHAVKNLTTAEGGCATWKHIDGIDDGELYHLYQLYSLNGQSKDALAKTKAGAWEYDIVGPWYKCNMTDIMAAIGLVQLKRYPSLIQRRYEIVKKYDEAMDAMHIEHIQHVSDVYHSSAHLYMIRIPDISVEQRNEIITRMAENGVATNVHYKPLPMMSGYKAYGWDIKDFPNAYHLYHNEITLPLHTLLSDEDVEIVIRTLRSTLEEMKFL